MDLGGKSSLDQRIAGWLGGVAGVLPCSAGGTIALVPAYLQFRVDLQHVQPAIWRRFLIRPEATFAGLHEAIQVACGWKSSHLFCFYPKAVGPNPIAGVPDEDYPGMPDAEHVPLDAYFGPSRRVSTSTTSATAGSTRCAWREGRSCLWSSSAS